jgi:hypothetical protein
VFLPEERDAEEGRGPNVDDHTALSEERGMSHIVQLVVFATM